MTGSSHVGGIVAPQSPLFGEAPLCGWGGAAFRVELIDKARADDVIRAGHYSHAVCWASSFHFGVFSEGSLIGVLQFGPLMNPRSADKIVPGCKGLELNRMWLADAKPVNAASRAIAFSLRVVRSRRSDIEWVQSFADERCGKFGAVYQAASFIYCGEHIGTFYELDGEWFHKSAIARTDKRGWGVGPKISRFNANLDRAQQHTFRQFRYIRLLTRRARSRLLLPSLPYPKEHGLPPRARMPTVNQAEER